MSFEEWRRQFPIQTNRTGVRLDLRLYVYADGHGNLLANDDARLNQPANNFEEAVDGFRRLWNRAMNEAPTRNVSTPEGSS